MGADSAAFVASNRATLKQAVTALVVIVVVVRVAKLAWHAAVLRSHNYRVSNHRIVVESGVLSKRVDEVDMRTVEDIEFPQMPMQRLFGIRDIAIVSTDKQMARFRLLGVEKPRDLRELIWSSAFQATSGQLFMRNT
ncbi:MAG: PH domain-containing protein [Myxococcales bacterium]